MRIFVQEFASGGGLLEEELHPSLLIEGFGILRALIFNFKKSGYEVITTLDHRIETLAPFLATEMIEIISNEQSVVETSVAILDKCDYFLVIAPGTNNVLSNFIEAYLKTGTKSLNCSTSAVDLATKKHQTYKFCSSLGINFPLTFMIQNNGSCNDIAQEESKSMHFSKFFQEKKLSFPVIVKPDEGVASEGLVLCTNQKELQTIVQEKHSDNLLLQEYIDGEHLSVTVNVQENKIQLFSINKQLISFNKLSSDYMGGVTNISHHLSQKLLEITSTLLSKISGINGLVGIDYIVRNNKIYFIEINPRATTPISCLLSRSQVPLDLISTQKNAPSNFDDKEINFFEKISLEKSKSMIIPYQELLDFNFILTPPLEISPNKILALIKGSGKTDVLSYQDFKNNLLILSNKLKKD